MEGRPLTASQPTLAEQLLAQSTLENQQISAEAQATMREAARELRDSGITDNSLMVGDKAPDFELTNATGESVRLSEQLAAGPVVLSFFRGGWCPYCQLELRAWQRALPSLKDLGANLLAISPQTPARSQADLNALNLGFELLYDQENMVARRYGLASVLPRELRDVYRQLGYEVAAASGEDSYELPIPATFVVDSDRTIRFAHVDTDYCRRAEPDDVLASLRND